MTKMPYYEEEELLMISGIQHFFYCQRQWALIHVEQQWNDNVYTVRGDIMHEKADDPTIVETRQGKRVSRAMPLVSYTMGFYGIADVVEFINNTVIVPIEYKVGKPKIDNCDKVQLCLQAICLEEMMDTEIDKGYLYYGKTRRREEVVFDQSLRVEVRDISTKMHELFMNGITPSATYSDKCNHCSLYHVCVPRTKESYKSVQSYIQHRMRGDDE